jgi:hypothetical protein
MVLRMPSSWWVMSCGGFGLLTRTSGKCTERCSVAPTVIASVTFTGTQTMPPQNLLSGVLYACRQTLWVRASGASRRRGLRLDFYSSRRPTCSICHPPLRLYLISETNTKGATQTTTSPPLPSRLPSSAPVFVGLRGPRHCPGPWTASKTHSQVRPGMIKGPSPLHPFPYQPVTIINPATRALGPACVLSDIRPSHLLMATGVILRDAVPVPSMCPTSNNLGLQGASRPDGPPPTNLP